MRVPSPPGPVPVGGRESAPCLCPGESEADSAAVGPTGQTASRSRRWLLRQCLLRQCLVELRSELGPEDVLVRDPGALLWTISFPVNQILQFALSPPGIQKFLDPICRGALNLHSLREHQFHLSLVQRSKDNWPGKRNMKHQSDPHVGGKCLPQCDWII